MKLWVASCICAKNQEEADETALWFEVLLYLIHLPILLSTTYCLAAGIAGGWHLLTERGCCRRDLWAKKRPVGVRDRCLGLQCWAPSQTLYAILHVCTNISNRQSYVGSSTFPWRLACVRFSTLCYRERPVGMNDESFFIWCGVLTSALCHLSYPPWCMTHRDVMIISSNLAEKWQYSMWECDLSKTLLNTIWD